jgi:hypothetical protein
VLHVSAYDETHNLAIHRPQFGSERKAFGQNIWGKVTIERLDETQPNRGL